MNILCLGPLHLTKLTIHWGGLFTSRKQTMFVNGAIIQSLARSCTFVSSSLLWDVNNLTSLRSVCSHYTLGTDRTTAEQETLKRKILRLEPQVEFGWNCPLTSLGCDSPSLRPARRVGAENTGPASASWRATFGGDAAWWSGAYPADWPPGGKHDLGIRFVEKWIMFLTAS